MTTRFVHSIRPRYAEIDQQGVVFNAHWLTYFDDACTRWFEWLGDGQAPAWFEEFDLMLVKATLEWSGPARFDEVVDIAVSVDRVGTSSFDLRYEASVGDRPVCIGVITYVSIRPGHHESTPIPEPLRTKIVSASVHG